ncbi:MAG: transposase [Thiothrix sp.]
MQDRAGVAFIDSTPLAVCENLRIPRHRTFSGAAGRGKSSTGWFYGFKLHLVVDDCGEILSFAITPGNTDDRKPVPTLLKQVTGKVFGDRGYISKELAALVGGNRGRMGYLVEEKHEKGDSRSFLMPSCYASGVSSKPSMTS